MKIVLFMTKVSSFVQGTQYNDIFNFRAWVRGDVKLELLHFFDRANLSIINNDILVKYCYIILKYLILICIFYNIAKNRYKQYQKQSKKYDIIP